jgi:hypothetical protein
MMSLISELGNTIDNRIQAINHIKNPKFHLNEVIEDAIINIF